MEGKNILYICDYAAAYSGNFIASLSALTESVQENNRVYFLFPSEARKYAWTKNLPVPEDHIFWCEFSVRSLMTACRHLRKLLGNNNTLVHTHFVGDWFLLAVRFFFPNVICHYHMTVPEITSVMKKLKQMVRWIIYHGIVIVGVSDPVTADLKKYFLKADCVSIPNAIDFQMLEKCSEGRPLPETFTDRDRFCILIHGSDFFRKAVDLAARAVQELERETQYDLSLYVTSHDTEYAESVLRELCGEAPNIHVLAPIENIKSLYDRVDLFISPSRLEAFGYAVVEASYCGCQVAASDIPGQNTMKGVPGILWFEKEDVQGLKHAILQALENSRSGEAARIKEAQRAYVAREFRVETWVDRNLDLYDRFFGRKSNN